MDFPDKLGGRSGNNAPGSTRATSAAPAGPFRFAAAVRPTGRLTARPTGGQLPRGRRRPADIPLIVDRVLQARVATALEPE